MKAITYTTYGPPEVLRVAEVDRPVPRDDEVLIRVRAAEATKSDVEMRRFRFAVSWFWLPLRLAFGVFKPRRHILGGYFSGEIAAIGKGVTGFRVGEPVFGGAGLRFGAYGEYLALPAGYPIAAKPANMDFAQAAAVPLGGFNALHFMRLARIRSGDTVLVHGAGGSIGTHAIQIAKSMGAQVTAVDSGIKEQMLRRIGADQFIDYTRQRFTELGRRYDVILDMVAGSDYGACIRTLTSGGRYLSCNPRLSVMFRAMLTTRFTGRTASFAFAPETKAALHELREMVEDGRIRSIVDKVYPMAQAADAHRRVEAEQRLGAVVLAIGDGDQGLPTHGGADGESATTGSGDQAAT